MPLTPTPFLSPNRKRHLHNKKYGTNYKPIESVDMKHPTVPVPPEITYEYSGESDSYTVKMEGAGTVYRCPTRREAKMFIAELKGRLLMRKKTMER